MVKVTLKSSKKRPNDKRLTTYIIITDYSMQKSSHLGPSAGLALGHRDQATRDSSHQGSCDEGCLHAEGFVQLLGSHAAEAEEEDARRKEHGLAQKRRVVPGFSGIWAATHILRSEVCESNNYKYLRS